MKDSSDVFKKALGNMTKEFAYKAAIRHLAEQEYSVKQIKEQLSYPVSDEEIAKTVYEYLVATKVICEEIPDETDVSEEVTYKLEEGPFGRKSYRRIVTKKEPKKYKYVSCSFGLMSEKELASIKSVLDKKDWEYISGIPWPRKTVYHGLTPRFASIYSRLDKKSTLNTG